MKRVLKSMSKWEIFAWIISGVTISIFILASSFSVFLADDFSHYNEVQRMSGTGILAKTMEYLISWYRYCAGVYFSIFINAILSPLEWGGIIWLRIFMMMNCLLFFVVLYFFLNTINKHFMCGIKTVYIFCAVILPLLNFRIYDEIFYWFSGACSYSIPMMLGIFGIGLMLRKKGRYQYILAPLLVFLANGGTLEISGTITYILLLITAVEWYKSKRVNKWFLSVFGISFLGALINVAAPGNYIRHGGEQLHVFLILLKTVQISLQEVGWLFRETVFAVVFVFSILLGLKVKTRIYLKEFLVLVVALWWWVIVTIYPVALGYTLSDISEFPNRTIFIIDVAVIISAVFVGMALGNLMADRIMLSNNFKFLVGMICVLFLLSKDFYPGGYGSIITAKGVLSGEIPQYAKSICELYNIIESSDEEDIIIQMPEPVNGFSHVGLNPDASHWINDSLAQYFGKERIWAR